MSTYLFIDGSYFCFYRFHALIHGGKTHRDEPLEDPYNNVIFVENYESFQ